MFNFFGKMPRRVYVVRHGRSLANEAMEEAIRLGQPRFRTPMPEHLSPLVRTGWEQCYSLARWFAALPAEERPTRIITSPYTRAVMTGNGLNLWGELDLPMEQVDCLHERHWGVLAGITDQAVCQVLPAEYALRKRLGEHRYRPTKGESRSDVVNRLRPFKHRMQREMSNDSLIIVSHSETILCMRQLFEGKSALQIERINQIRRVPNCSVCVYGYSASGSFLGCSRKSFGLLTEYLVPTPATAPEGTIETMMEQRSPVTLDAVLV